MKLQPGYGREKSCGEREIYSDLQKLLVATVLRFLEKMFCLYRSTDMVPEIFVSRNQENTEIYLSLDTEDVFCWSEL